MVMQRQELSRADAERLAALQAALEEASQTFLGYPCNQEFDYSALFDFLKFPVNNIGDPFLPSIYRLNTHALECEVLEFFRALTHAPGDSFWGYITNGGTEGNMYGLFLARELLPHGIVYYSEETHYSVSKILRVLNARHIMIRAQAHGEIDYEDLRATLSIHRDTPPIIMANIGTTVKGAVDNLAQIKAILKELALTDYYIHCDAALSGMILPFIADAPPFRFSDGADSIAISGHKMIGAPFPCGVALARKGNVQRIARSVEYVGILDTTLSGSRNAIAPLFLWYAIKTVGVEGFRARVADCLRMADYAIERLNTLGLGAWRHPHSITVVFRRPAEAIIRRWQLAPHRDVAHIVVMPHVRAAQIDALVEDIKKSLANDPDQHFGQAAEKGP